jgi:hypothetical protein
MTGERFRSNEAAMRDCLGRNATADEREKSSKLKVQKKHHATMHNDASRPRLDLGSLGRLSSFEL